MQTYLECVPCMVRQTLDSVQALTNDSERQTSILREVLKILSEMDLNQSPPEMAQTIHRIIRTHISIGDPYSAKKYQFNKYALDRYAELKSNIKYSSNPLETATRLAIAGNVIDFGANSGCSEANASEVIGDALTLPLMGDLQAFQDTISESKSILYLTDNAGEIVFDKLLIETLPLEKITVGVRGSPVLNDATLEDARISGLAALVRVIDNGSDAPGTILSDCSQAFRQQFEEADVVIAKGQGNYETLSDVEKDIFFLLLVKCPLIARDTGCPVGSFVLHRSNHRAKRLNTSKSEYALQGG